MCPSHVSRPRERAARTDHPQRFRGRLASENVIPSHLISLCPYHHQLVHDRGYLIAAGPAGAFTFFRPDGTGIPPSPALPPPGGPIDGCHDADITPGTIIPAWYGERLDLDYAIHACFANAEYHARQASQPDHASQTDQDQPPVAAAEPQDPPWTPTATEVDIMAAICDRYKQHATSTADREPAVSR